MILEHLGKLHPVEQLLVLVLAFGPILLLGVTIRIARKRIDREDGAPEKAPERAPERAPDQAPGQAPD